MGEYEHLVTMRVDRKPDSEQNSYLLTCLLKRPGSLDKFRKILVDTKAAHLVERIKSKLLGKLQSASLKFCWIYS